MYQTVNNDYHLGVEIEKKKKKKSSFTFTLNPSIFLKWMFNL